MEILLTDPFGEERQISFSSVAELSSWVNGELSFVRTLGKLVGRLATVESHLSRLAMIAEATKVESPESLKQTLIRIDSRVGTYLAYHNYIDSSHPLAGWIKSLSEVSSSVPSGVIDTLGNQTTSYLALRERVAVEYAVGRYLTEGGTNHSKSAMAQVKRSVTRVEKKLATLEADRAAIRKSADTDLAEIRTEFSKALTALNGRATHVQRKIAFRNLARVRRMLRKGRESRRAINETNRQYREDLSLEPAVEYWRRQETHHETKAKTLKEWMLGSVAAAFVILVALAILVAWKEPFSGELGDPNVIFVSATLVALLTLLFWVGRVLARQYLGHVHMRNDARERATVVQSFLALNIDGVATEKDRAVMLSTVFRPSTDGVVKDDAAPALSIAALLSGGLSKD